MRYPLAAAFVLLALIMISGCSHPRAEIYVPPPEHRDCASCHVFDGDKGVSSLTLPAVELCASCHAERTRQGEHRVGMAPSKKDITLPLPGGKVECISCHEPHGLSGNIALLRTSPETICSNCHDM